MNTASRGIRNAFRNSIRTVSIVIILGLSIGLALAMLVARASVEDKITSVKTSIGNTITISPAGSQGFQGGGEPLKTEQLAQVAKLANVTNVTQTLNDRLITENTNLVSAIEPGSLGNRAGRNSGVGFVPPPDTGDRVRPGGASNQQITRSFTPPLIVTGTNDLSSVTSFGGNKASFSSGQAFDASKDEDVAVVGKALATKNSLIVGSTFTAYGKPVKVVGIYDTGNTFTDAGLVMPLSALQRLSDQAGSVTGSVVTVNSVDTIDSAAAAIKSTLGDKADVVSNQDSAKQAIEPLQNVKTISSFSVIGAVGAGALIILLTMVMIVRERRREIGVFKAIGASNLKVMLQFMSEAVTLTALGLVAGLIIGTAAASPVTHMLVNNATSSNRQTTDQVPQRGQRRAGGFGGAGDSLRSVQASVGTDIIGYGVATAFIIAIVGSAIPAFFISKVRPAEVMRAE